VVDHFVPAMSDCFKDPASDIRRHALIILSRLLQVEVVIIIMSLIPYLGRLYQMERIAIFQISRRHE
jgi:hypothetical protein